MQEITYPSKPAFYYAASLASFQPTGHSVLVWVSIYSGWVYFVFVLGWVYFVFVLYFVNFGYIQASSSLGQLGFISGVLRYGLIWIVIQVMSTLGWIRLGQFGLESQYSQVALLQVSGQFGLGRNWVDLFRVSGWVVQIRLFQLGSVLACLIFSLSCI